jgi:hypothetical protein
MFVRTSPPAARRHDGKLLRVLQVYGCATRAQLMDACGLEPSACNRAIHRLCAEGVLRRHFLYPDRGRASPEVIVLADSSITVDPYRLQFFEMALQRRRTGWRLRVVFPRCFLERDGKRRAVIVARPSDDADGSAALQRIVELRKGVVEYVDPEVVRASIVHERSGTEHLIRVYRAQPFTDRMAAENEPRDAGAK